MNSNRLRDSVSNVTFLNQCHSFFIQNYFVGEENKTNLNQHMTENSLLVGNVNRGSQCDCVGDHMNDL